MVIFHSYVNVYQRVSFKNQFSSATPWDPLGPWAICRVHCPTRESSLERLSEKLSSDDKLIPQRASSNNGCHFHPFPMKNVLETAGQKKNQKSWSQTDSLQSKMSRRTYTPKKDQKGEKTQNWHAKAQKSASETRSEIVALANSVLENWPLNRLHESTPVLLPETSDLWVLPIKCGKTQQ